jgi:DNA-binding NtrC family response regulator
MVDDETDFLLLGQQILNLLGYHPITAENCNDALVQFKQSPDKIELVIMDMIMPDGDVHETIQRLREMKPNIRILLSSGHSQNGEIGRKLMPHCQGFIQKPFRLASISQKIKEMLGTTENENQ